MAKRKRKNAMKRLTARYGAMGCFLAILIAVLYYLFSQGIFDSLFGQKPPLVPLPDGTVEIHMIDVGQADAVLIQSGDGFMLIDAADRESDSKEKLNTYLTNVGITTLEWLVLTHPDADHIGGAQMILENYEVKNVMLSDRIHTSDTYGYMLEAIIAEPDVAVHIVDVNATLDTDTDDVTAQIYDAGDAFEWRKLHFTIMAPLATPNNNDSSVVLRM
ncbi:MAG: MBL fold metallo-hydrolase, partial [Clostridia bacterium]|nr:MBL fold metallo-hydrolase [Clostridia bacterium]